MAIRALVFEDDRPIRELLVHILEGRGYEVVAFAEPAHCGVYKDGPCSCPEGTVCGDVLITDLEMPGAEGLQVIQDQVEKGCNVILENMAVMSGGWNAERLARAESLGVRIFRKPFQFKELAEWLDDCEARISRDRVLREKTAFEARPLRRRSSSGGA